LRAQDISEQTKILLDEYKSLTEQSNDWNKTLSIEEFLTFRKAAIYEVEKRVAPTRNTELQFNTSQLSSATVESNNNNEIKKSVPLSVIDRLEQRSEIMPNKLSKAERPKLVINSTGPTIYETPELTKDVDDIEAKADDEEIDTAESKTRKELALFSLLKDD